MANGLIVEKICDPAKGGRNPATKLADQSNFLDRTCICSRTWRVLGVWLTTSEILPQQSEQGLKLPLSNTDSVYLDGLMHQNLFTLMQTMHKDIFQPKIKTKGRAKRCKNVQNIHYMTLNNK